MADLQALDRKYLWHPFTPFDTWLDESRPITFIAAGEGCLLEASDGKRYLDGNSSIWTNLHGHREPRISKAIADQLGKIAHSSFLGLSNELAPLLAERLANSIAGAAGCDASDWRVFLSDDGSTAIEAAIKIVFQYFQQNGQKERTTFVSLSGAYHGDTVGAMSVGHSAAFHSTYRNLLFESREIPAPNCYRCPYNRALPSRADARTYRQCEWECVGAFQKTVEPLGSKMAAWVMEPRVQGAAGMIMHPAGYAEKTCAIAQAQGAKVILDEVMTGFFRTGELFAFGHEKVRPDLVALAKGLTGGYLPLAATLVEESIAEGFRGGLERTFYHGHSYTGNQLGCAAALASLDIIAEPDFAPQLLRKSQQLGELAQIFWEHPHVGDVRREGLILAIELVEDFATRKPFQYEQRIGFRVCEAARQYGLLTRPVGDVLLLMPPYCTTEEQLAQMVTALYKALHDVLPLAKGYPCPAS